MLVQRLQAHLLALLAQPSTPALGQERRDFYLIFQQRAADWLRMTADGLLALGRPLPAMPSVQAAFGDELSLVGEDTVEVQILAARAALSAMDKGSGDFNDLRLRLQHLEGTHELLKADPVHALNVAQVVVDAWLLAGFPREQWLRSQSIVQPLLAQAIADGYRMASGFLLDRGVLPEIDLRGLVRRSPAPAGGVPVQGVQAAQTIEPSAVSVSPRPAGGASSVQAPAALAQWLTQRVPRMGVWLQQRSASTASVSATAVPMAQAVSQLASSHSSLMSPPETPLSAPALDKLIADLPPIDWSTLAAGRAALQLQTRVLKAQLHSEEEKAIVEVVALIFDGILSEERIPSSIRVWFARLQMPVLRHAMSDPGFLADELHPARCLIDRMGACVMGFEASVSMEPLQQEIKRIVQVIEQYPDTGRRVFEITYQEFQAFLASHFCESSAVQHIADVAQQAEHKEALTVQYTIELRQLLAQASVPEAVRRLLFQTWAEAMAMAAVVYGVTDPRAKSMRQVAADLVWAVGAKSSRQERAQVVARLPLILQQLREGFALLVLDEQTQKALIKSLNESLAEAFLARTCQLDPLWLRGLTESLDQVDGFLGELDGPLTFDQDMLAMITGTDAAHITALMDTGDELEAEALLQTELLGLGSWFHWFDEGQMIRVQLAWVSTARQLYLFVSSNQHALLMQQGRVAQSLHAGSLQPLQSEGLLLQASRLAVQVLEAQPERLLA